MRYLLVSYFKTPKGQMDEQVCVARNIRTADIQTCAVILDFRKGQVVKATLNGTNVPRDWIKIRDFYQKHYAKLVEDLEAIHGRYEVEEKKEGVPENTPSEAT